MRVSIGVVLILAWGFFAYLLSLSYLHNLQNSDSEYIQFRSIGLLLNGQEGIQQNVQQKSEEERKYTKKSEEEENEQKQSKEEQVEAIIPKSGSHQNDVDRSFAERNTTLSVPFFKKQHYYPCEGIFTNSLRKEDLKRTDDPVFPRRTEYKLYLQLMSNCDYIRNSFYWPSKPLSAAEAAFPLAYAMTVYTDAHHVIALVNAIFAPQNIYYLSIDLKAPQMFRFCMENFVRCLSGLGFNNVKIHDKSYPIIPYGFTFLQPLVEMISDLEKLNHTWKYVITAFNYQFPLRTNAEIVQVLSMHEGVSNVQIASKGHEDRLKSRRTSYRFDINGVPILHNSKYSANNPLPDNITTFKGLCSVSLSRQFAHFISNDLSAQKFYNYLEDTMTSDEHYFNTLYASPELNAPGGYPGRCFLKCHKRIEGITRHSIWVHGNSKQNSLCTSRDVRHQICMISPRMLPQLLTLPQFFADKFVTRTPERGAVARECLRELLHNRTYEGSTLGRIDAKEYEGLEAVRYGRHLKSGKLPEDYDCGCRKKN